MSSRLSWILTILIIFGLVVLSSASVVVATKQHGSAWFFLWNQITRGIIPGILLLFIFRKIPYQKLRPFALPLLTAALGLLILVITTRFGLHFNGATSWLDIGWISFQPAEALKLALILYLAAWLGERGERLHRWQSGLVPFIVIMGFVCLLLLLQPDLGTLGIVLISSIGVYFVAGAPMKQALLLTLVGVLIIGLFALTSPERWSRIITLIRPTEDTQGSGWQLHQSLIAIGSGGVWGKGFGQSTEKFGLLPEPMGDSIFAVLVEELGFVGGICTVGLFVLLSIFLLQIAARAPDSFGSLIAVGMCFWIATQTLVHMAAVTGIGPLTGIPLPFISYGGSSMAFMLAGMGIVLNISDHA